LVKSETPLRCPCLGETILEPTLNRGESKKMRGVQALREREALTAVLLSHLVFSGSSTFARTAGRGHSIKARTG
jgi:hypothetical protein